MYGVIARFDLRADRVAEFDALAEWRLREVARCEPGMVAYGVHRIDGDPLARVFYEVYDDRRAFEEHRATPQTARFREEHQPYVTGPPRIEFLEIACAAGGLTPRVPGQKEEAPR